MHPTLAFASSKLRPLAMLPAVAFILALATPRVAAGADPGPPVAIDFGVKVPLRDGVHLNATIYRPRTQSAPLPVIVTVTPYISDRYHGVASYFASHGYVYAVVDCRGRGSSEGTFEPMASEARDGFDLVGWLAAQSWSNGKVAMMGGSYGGYDQWATAGQNPPALATIVPVASAFPGFDFPMSGNVRLPYAVRWLTLTAGRTPNNSTFADDGYWNGVFRELFRRQLPLTELDRLAGNPSSTFQRWLSHPELDDFWAALVPTREQLAGLEMPILTITGTYDGDQPGALEHYRRHLAATSEAGRARHYLIVGPWDHAGTRNPNPEIGGVKFGPASVLDMNDLHRQWYDWVLKGGEKPAFLQDRVAYYLPVADRWKYAPSIEAIAGERLTLYLDSPGSEAADVFHSGTLRPGPATDPTPDAFVSDPNDLSAADEPDNPHYITAQEAALGLHGDGLIYHSAPFTKATEITGTPELSLWLAVDTPDVDLAASLYEVLADGSSVSLSSQLLRARYRASLNHPQAITPGKIERYEFRGFTFFARQLAPGSRLRLIISAVNDPQIEKNYNAGGVVATESGKDARVAHVRLFHDAEHPSLLHLPLVSNER